MYYVTKLIYFIILVLCANPLLAQDTRYRVELLVLTHLNHGEEAADSNEISDYSSAIDFLTPVEETEEDAEEETKIENLARMEAAEPLPQIIDSEVEEEPDPNALVHMEEMSEVMRETWRRLRLSAPFRPQQYLSWEQGNQEPFPALRIHDLEVIMSKDKYAKQRLEMQEADLLEDESERQEQRELIFADPAGISELTGDPEQPALPEPALYYR